MMSSTGSRPLFPVTLRKGKGLTFIEVMITTVILAVGLVAIYRSFFIGLDYLNHLSCRLYALNFIENKIASVERDFRSPQDFDIGPLSDHAMVNNRMVDFDYHIDLEPVGNLPTVFKLNVALSWEERGRIVAVSRSAYFSGIMGTGEGG